MILLAALIIMASDKAPATQLQREAVLEFAKCVERRAPDRAAALLASEPGSKGEREKAETIAGAYSACILDKNALSFPTTLLRGQLAELAFQRDAALREKAGSLTSAAPLIPDTAAIDKDIEKVDSAHRENAYAAAFRVQYARCVAGVNPAAVAALVQVAPGSVDERQQLIAAGDTLMRCMPPGIAYHIKTGELRPYLLSELYYRVITSTPGGARS